MYAYIRNFKGFLTASPVLYGHKKNEKINFRFFLRFRFCRHHEVWMSP